VWDAETGEKIRSLKGRSGAVDCLYPATGE
jgi:hypothetical protein